MAILVSRMHESILFDVIQIMRYLLYIGVPTFHFYIHFVHIHIFVIISFWLFFWCWTIRDNDTAFIDPRIGKLEIGFILLVSIISNIGECTALRLPPQKKRNKTEGNFKYIIIMMCEIWFYSYCTAKIYTLFKMIFSTWIYLMNSACRGAKLS